MSKVASDLNRVSGDIYRKMEADSIRWFMVNHGAPYLANGRVLDFGAGRQPYADLVAGSYNPYDRAGFPASVAEVDAGPSNPLTKDTWDAVMMNQVIQYLDQPLDTLVLIYRSLHKNGYLVMTYPTTWPEVEPEDKWRFTKVGMEALLLEAGWSKILVHEQRAKLDIAGFPLALGYGVVCQK